MSWFIHFLNISAFHESTGKIGNLDSGTGFRFAKICI